LRVIRGFPPVFVRFVRFELMLGLGKKRGRPRKSLAELIEDGSFLARRHAELLAGDDVEDPTLAAVQALYRQAGDDRQRRRVALQFEKLVRKPVLVEEPAVEAVVEFDEPLAVPESPV
jgi:hypothetical protein